MLVSWSRPEPPAISNSTATLIVAEVLATLVKGQPLSEASTWQRRIGREGAAEARRFALP
jgi:hypothetical protein